MLPPDGRAVLIEQLRPPQGARLTYGVATTFTLDFTSALAAPLAFASHRLHSDKDPIAVLEAVRHAADRIDIFCQAGQMIVPAQASDLMAYLEPMIHAVKPPHPGRLFHPKIWLLQFEDGEDVTFRFLCMSRNLTGDRSWDVIARLDGLRGSRPMASNAPLRALVQALPTWAVAPLSADRRSRIRALADEVRYAVWDRPEDIDTIRFHALGVTSRRSTIDFAGTRHLVVSPFCKDDGLALTAPKGSKSVQLVSRVEDVDRLAPQSIQRLERVLVLDDMAGMDPSDADEPAPVGSAALVGLHAKAYVVERGHRAHLFLGSANATHAAFDGNVEFLVELEGTKNKVGIDAMVGADAPLLAVLLDYAATGGLKPSADDELDYALEHALRELATVVLAAQVTADCEPYGEHVSGDLGRIREGIKVSIELITRPGEARDVDGLFDADFTGLPITDVTPFIVLRATDQRGESRATVVPAVLTGDPPGRRDELLARRVNTPEKFLRFLSLLLSLGDGFGTRESVDRDGQGGGGWGVGKATVFESLVRALGDQPGALDDLSSLVDRLRSTDSGRRVLPEGFDELWDLMSQARVELAGDHS